jgi:thiamine-monophosphate kinase
LPQPRLGLSGPLQDLITAAIDVSDGLVADLGHICEQSGIAAEVSLADLPLSPPVQMLISAEPNLAETVITGGDDYELLLAGRDESAIERIAERFGVAITPIGRFVAGRGVSVTDLDGRPMTLSKSGYRHM